MVYVYNPYGAFIQDINGELYTKDEWDGTKTPNGIAVKTDKCQFVVPLNMQTTSVKSIASTSFIYPDMPELDKESALLDFDGAGNTAKMIKVFTGGNAATQIALNYTFPNGKKGYLPAIGELAAFRDNSEAIFTLLTKCGYESYKGKCFSLWSSTRAKNNSDQNCCFYLHFYDNSYGPIVTTDEYRLLPFTSI